MPISHHVRNYLELSIFVEFTIIVELEDCPRTVLAGEQFLKRGYSETRFFFFESFPSTGRERRG